MKYMGSKNRIAKYICPIIVDIFNNNDCEIFIDCCVGGANLLDKIPSNIPKFGNDINEYLVAMWNKVSDGWLPPENITEDDYLHIRNNKDENKALTGYVGFALSYGGKWFGGWCRDKEGKRNYVDESYRNACKQFPLLKDVRFSNKSLFDICPKKKALLYVDPPYKNTTKYKDDFNHEELYKWCRNMKNKGHILLISEYEMPSDFICLWQKEQTSSLTKNTGGKKATERLFIL